ncbi:MAG: metal ABC transporter substrate-binding protein [Acholeplasmataceae bacterium]
MKVFLKMKIYLITALSLVLLLTACQKKESAEILTTLFPHYDIAAQIAGDKLTVGLLAPLGSEVHGYEPTAKEIIAIKSAKLFIYTSPEMDPWVNNILDNQVNALNLANSITQLDDIHYWTDPIVFLLMIEEIKIAIIEIDPDNADYYLNNALSYSTKIETIHLELSNFLDNLSTPTIYFFGHNSMSLFADRYHLNIVSITDHFQPDAELTPKQLEEFINELRMYETHYLFVEELIDTKHFNSIKTELENDNYQLTILELHGYHNISKDQYKKGVSYADLLEQNYENIKQALNN